ncbi:histidine phosphatase family protein [Acetobacterium carbinolicum]|jgi:probable phosphoglycerate mutase|uniref:histidine phosphatase family protein n=1 Tax=Acetobacterium carbinolicum TaxID=52690 RepID=UPI0039C8D19E
MKIYLVRHGKIKWLKGKAYIGQIDLPLSQEGIIQSQELREAFAEISLTKVYTSPLKRCVQTLDILLAKRNVPTVLVDALKEINMGDWDGRTIDEIKINHPEDYQKRGRLINTFVPPGGESFEALTKRVMPEFNKMIKENYQGAILISTHAGVIRVILGEVMGLSINELFKWKLLYGTVFELDYDERNDKWVVVNR